jgi:very-long-chain enoyl-CoA reductase
MSKLDIEVFDAKSTKKTPITISDVSPNDNVLSLKRKISAKNHLSVDRLSIRLEPRGKNVADEKLVSELNLPTKNAQLYVRDLGPQIAWKTVFLLEYAGPLFVYPIFYLRPSFIYGADASSKPVHQAVFLALLCHSFHYAKRLYETQFVHRFSNGTMPFTNLFKNCSYYWGFAAFMSYFVNHPLYTPPMLGSLQIYAGLIGFVLCEAGNFSIHTLLRDLRPPGTKERKVPYPNSNPLTQMYNFTSCPNYTYEVGAWISFSLMTQCLPALFFTLAGFAQMKIWADGKHRNYKKEFSNYPKTRKPIIPFLC